MSEKRDPFDGDYIGNVFGPKLTRYGAILILFFTGLALYRHWSMDIPFGWEEPKEESAITPPNTDTLKIQE